MMKSLNHTKWYFCLKKVKVKPTKCAIKSVLFQPIRYNSGSTTNLKDHHFCVDIVKTRDKEGYLCGLLQPSGVARDAYFAIRAFNVEIASIKDGQKSRSGESIRASQMRMNWWREAIENIYRSNQYKDMNQIENSATLHQPVIRALQQSVFECKLTRRFLDKMIDARERDLDVEQMDTIDDLIRYGADTWSCLMYLSLESVGVRDELADNAAFHIGVAQTIVTTLRSIPYTAARGEIAIPLDLMEKYSIPSTYLLRPENDSFKPALREAVIQMANTARIHLNEARNLQADVPKKGRVSLLPAVGSLLYLEKLEKIADFDVLHKNLHIEEGGFGYNSAIWYPLMLGRTWITGVF